MAKDEAGKVGPESTFDRGRFGATVRRKPRDGGENRAPISSAELSKGPTELAENRGARVNWRVFVIASCVIVAFSLWAILAPTNAANT